MTLNVFSLCKMLPDLVDKAVCKRRESYNMMVLVRRSVLKVFGALIVFGSARSE